MTTKNISEKKFPEDSEDDEQKKYAQILYRYRLGEAKCLMKNKSAAFFEKKGQRMENSLFDAARLSEKERKVIREMRDEDAKLWAEKAFKEPLINLADMMDFECPKMQKRLSNFEKYLEVTYGETP